jgi:hypothetical protein
MKLDTLWIVRDPSPHSRLGDLVFGLDVGRLSDYVLGCPPGTWRRELHTLFTEKDEAVAEAVRRLVRLRPHQEGWINDEAYRLFGYGASKGGRP